MWCQNDKHGFMNNTTGQIQPNDPTGKILMKYILNNDLRNILDIGTWNGLGSTRCFLFALQGNTTTRLISIEVHKDKQQMAVNNLQELLHNSNAQIIHGGILKSDEIVNIGDIFPDFLSNPEYQRWHAIDVWNIDNAPYLFDDMPDEIDFVLFDGGEFTTYYEFIKLLPRCKKLIALDDVNVSKCAKVRGILQTHPDWEEVEYVNYRNGFSIFQYNKSK